jgi:hypothetical protein
MIYKNYEIKPGEYTKFDFVHLEYDGPEDRRLGHGRSIDDCKQQIDEMEWENEAIHDVEMNGRTYTFTFEESVKFTNMWNAIHLTPFCNP